MKRNKSTPETEGLNFSRFLNKKGKESLKGTIVSFEAMIQTRGKKMFILYLCEDKSIIDDYIKKFVRPHTEVYPDAIEGRMKTPMLKTSTIEYL